MDVRAVSLEIMVTVILFFRNQPLSRLQTETQLVETCQNYCFWTKSDRFHTISCDLNKIKMSQISKNIISHRLKGGPLWIFDMFPRDERKPVSLRIQEISQPLSGITVTYVLAGYHTFGQPDIICLAQISLFLSKSRCFSLIIISYSNRFLRPKTMRLGQNSTLLSNLFILALKSRPL